MGGREPRKTRKARKDNSEPRMDTNGHEWEIQNHEWTRKGNPESRMDTNGWEETTKHTKGTKGEYRATNGHELSSFPLLFKGILHITHWKSMSYFLGHSKDCGKQEIVTFLTKHLFLIPILTKRLLLLHCRHKHLPDNLSQ